MTLNDQNEAVSQAELARRLGLTRGRISQYKSCGMPVRPDGKVEVSEALDWIARNTDPNRRKHAVEPGNGNASPPADFNEIRTEHERVKLARARQAYERESGVTVYKADVEAAIYARARMEREAHENFTVRVAPLLAAEFGADERAMLEALDRHMREHLEALAKAPLEMTTDEPGNGTLG